MDRFKFFNFYPGYLWRDVDFATFQGLMDGLSDTPWSGAVKSAILDGYDYSSASGFDVVVKSGIAVDADGSPLSVTGTSTVTVAGPSGGLGRKSLVVVREVFTNENYIAEPANPSNLVPLNTTQSAEVMVIDGNPSASPAYPDKGAHDVVLFGLLIGGADTQITADSVDYSKSEFVGKNSDLLKLAGWDAIVGLERFCTHRTINDLMASTGIDSVKRVRIMGPQSLSSTQVVNHPEKIISWDSDAIWTNAGAGLGLQVAATGVHLENPRMKDFTTAIEYTAAADFGTVLRPWYKNCTTKLTDNTTDGVESILTIVET